MEHIEVNMNDKRLLIYIVLQKPTDIKLISMPNYNKPAYLLQDIR